MLADKVVSFPSIRSRPSRRGGGGCGLGIQLCDSMFLEFGNRQS